MSWLEAWICTHCCMHRKFCHMRSQDASAGAGGGGLARIYGTTFPADVKIVPRRCKMDLGGDPPDVTGAPHYPEVSFRLTRCKRRHRQPWGAGVDGPEGGGAKRWGLVEGLPQEQQRRHVYTHAQVYELPCFPPCAAWKCIFLCTVSQDRDIRWKHLVCLHGQWSVYTHMWIVKMQRGTHDRDTHTMMLFHKARNFLHDDFRARTIERTNFWSCPAIILNSFWFTVPIILRSCSWKWSSLCARRGHCCHCERRMASTLISALVCSAGIDGGAVFRRLFLPRDCWAGSARAAVFCVPATQSANPHSHPEGVIPPCGSYLPGTGPKKNHPWKHQGFSALCPRRLVNAHIT